MGNLGPAELLVILAIALIVFGPKKLPEVGRNVGQAMREFQKAKDDFMSSIQAEALQEAAAHSPMAEEHQVTDHAGFSETEPRTAAATPGAVPGETLAGDVTAKPDTSHSTHASALRTDELPHPHAVEGAA